MLSTVTLKYRAFSIFFFFSSLGGKRNECARVKTVSHKEGDMRANESNSTSSYIRKFFVLHCFSENGKFVRACQRLFRPCNSQDFLLLSLGSVLQLVMQGFCEFC